MNLFTVCFTTIIVILACATSFWVGSMTGEYGRPSTKKSTKELSDVSWRVLYVCEVEARRMGKRVENPCVNTEYEFLLQPTGMFYGAGRRFFKLTVNKIIYCNKDHERAKILYIDNEGKVTYIQEKE